MHRVCFATWNVNWMTRSAESHRIKVDYLAGKPWDILALQEATPGLIDTIRGSGVAEVVAYPHSTERFASALLARNGFDLRQVSLIATSPQARRAVCAHVVGPSVELDAVSWHAPNAVGSGSAGKRDGYVAFVDWRGGRRGPLLVGADANHGSFFAREQDFPGSPFKPFPQDDWFEENAFWTDPEPDLRDAWIEYLAQNPDVLAEVRADWTGGPSAVSYVRGVKENLTPDRFDYVLVSPEFTIDSVAYDYEGSVAARSDHALVTAVLSLTEASRRGQEG